MRIFAWGLVTLASVVLVAGILAGLYIINISSLLPAATAGLQSPAMKPFWDTLVSGFHIVGAAVLVSGVALGGLLLGIGFLVSRNQALAVRLDNLEAIVERSKVDQDPCPTEPPTVQRRDQ